MHRLFSESNNMPGRAGNINENEDEDTAIFRAQQKKTGKFKSCKFTKMVSVIKSCKALPHYGLPEIYTH